MRAAAGGSKRGAWSSMTRRCTTPAGPPPPPPARRPGERGDDGHVVALGVERGDASGDVVGAGRGTREVRTPPDFGCGPRSGALCPRGPGENVPGPGRPTGR